MRRFLVFALVLLPVLCWGQPDTLWTRTISIPNHGSNRAVAETTDGGFMIAGMYRQPGGNQYYLHLVRLNANGDTVFTRVGPSAQAPFAYFYMVETMISDGGSGFIVLGRDGLVRVNSLGNTLWTRCVRSEVFGPIYGDYNSGSRCLALTADHGCLLAGYGVDYDPEYGIWYYPLLEKRDSLGNQAWLSGTMGTLTFVIRPLSNGFYYCPSTQNGNDLQLVCLNSAGETVWTRHHTLSIPAVANPAGLDIAQVLGGGYVCIYEPQTSAATYPVTLVRMDSYGGTLWTK